MYVLFTVLAAGHLRVDSASKDAIQIDPTSDASSASFANTSESESLSNVTNPSRATVPGSRPQKTPRAAVLLFGISYGNHTYHDGSGISYVVDFLGFDSGDDGFV